MAVAPALAGATIKLARAVAAGQAPEGAVALLAGAVLKEMATAKVKVVAVGAVLALVAALGVGSAVLLCAPAKVGPWRRRRSKRPPTARTAPATRCPRGPSPASARRTFWADCGWEHAVAFAGDSAW